MANKRNAGNFHWKHYMSNMNKSVNNLRAMRDMIFISLCKLGLIICSMARHRNCTVTLSQAFGYVWMSAKSEISFMGCSDPILRWG